MEGFGVVIGGGVECRLGNPAPTGSSLDPMFSFGIRPTISRKSLSEFETRSIHKVKILQHVASCNPRRSERTVCQGSIAVKARTFTDVLNGANGWFHNKEEAEGG